MHPKRILRPSTVPCQTIAEEGCRSLSNHNEKGKETVETSGRHGVEPQQPASACEEQPRPSHPPAPFPPSLPSSSDPTTQEDDETAAELSEIENPGRCCR